MLIVHLLAGLITGFLCALLAWGEGASLLVMLLAYTLGGTSGLVISGAVTILMAVASADGTEDDTVETA